MQSSKLLACALTLGIAAFIASLVPMAATGAKTQLQVTAHTTVNLPGIMKIFGGRNKATESITTYSDKGIRTESGDNATIVQCDLKRFITVNKKDKTYTITPLEKLFSKVPAPSGSPVAGRGAVSVKIDEKADSQTQTILGMTAHHAVDTITMAEQGTGQCANFQMSMTVDQWYANYKIPYSCPNAPPTGSLAQQGNPCMQSFQVEANSKLINRDRLPLKSTVSMNFGPMSTSVVTETTAVNSQPYDPSLFGIPAGYTEKQQ